jgi:hypothetical protein
LSSLVAPLASPFDTVVCVLGKKEGSICTDFCQVKDA